MVYNCKVLEYAENRAQLRFYPQEIHVNDSISSKISDKIQQSKELNEKQGIESDKEKSNKNSLNRTIKTIYEITRSNVWDYFITFTFNPERINRQNYDDCLKACKNYLDFIKRNYCRDLKYICIPEFHPSDGVSYHFHGLLGNCDNLPTVESGIFDKKGRVIYNLPNYIYGWNTATKIDNNFAVCAYMTKYISKDLVTNTSYQNRYICSRNVNRPKETNIYMNDNTFRNILTMNIDDVLYTKKVKTDNGYMYYVELKDFESLDKYLLKLDCPFTS